MLYHADGRVVKAQEERLETEAKEWADSCAFTDPIAQAKQIMEGRTRAEELMKDEGKSEKAFIVIDTQHYRELYYSSRSVLTGEYLMFGENNPLGETAEEGKIPEEGIDRRTLMKCSSAAYDYFTLKPDDSILHLPVCYPRQHQEAWYNHYKDDRGRPDLNLFKEAWGEGRIDEEGLAYTTDADDQMAYIREHEIRHYLIPWLKAMEEHTKEDKNKSKKNAPMNQSLQDALNSLPSMGIPTGLVEKIHLYNVLLQLGISTYFQQPLIDALILQMYQTNPSQCHLDTLEMTVGRFYSRGVAVLDPVMNHLIGTYSLRTLTDRGTSPSEDDRALKILPEEDDNRDLDQQVYLRGKPRREWLRYTDVRPDERSEFPEDTVIHPPKLEVIGHCIKHWSGVRKSGSTAAAHTGYPLNVGRVFKYYRRNATSPIYTENRPGCIDKADYSTYRLHNSNHTLEYLRQNRPGSVPAPAPTPAIGPGPSPDPNTTSASSTANS